MESNLKTDVYSGLIGYIVSTYFGLVILLVGLIWDGSRNISQIKSDISSTNKEIVSENYDINSFLNFSKQVIDTGHSLSVLFQRDSLLWQSMVKPNDSIGRMLKNRMKQLEKTKIVLSERYYNVDSKVDLKDYYFDIIQTLEYERSIYLNLIQYLKDTEFSGSIINPYVGINNRTTYDVELKYTGLISSYELQIVPKTKKYLEQKKENVNKLQYDLKTEKIKLFLYILSMIGLIIIFAYHHEKTKTIKFIKK